ncbi:MAG TPA: hypothetical protein VEV83_11530 [Parafilimonas sp.]|nr:hypothetical protein [Parafilimonas sp.]
MKQIQTTVVALLLVLAFSCSKDNNSGASGQSGQSSASSSISSDAQESIDQDVDVPVTGNWILYYDWLCSGLYSAVALDVYANGTWHTGSGYTGEWVEGRRIFMRKYDGFETVYSGIIRSEKKISGIMTTWDGTHGCFYMVPATDPKFKAEINGSRDESGKTR